MSQRLRTLRRVLKPFAQVLLYNSLRPGPLSRWLYDLGFDLHWSARETLEWLHRSLIATPVFLSKCASFGQRIAIDRVPYVSYLPRVELGSDIRISGQLTIHSDSRRNAVLRIGNGVFLGHGTTISVAKHVEIGNFASIGAGTFIADTEGHAHYNPQKPIWQVPASDDDVGPVIIEDNVQIGRQCMILKGVTIGARSVIGAGTVVRSSIAPDSIVMGNPGRVARTIQPAPAAEPAAGSVNAAASSRL